MVSVPYRGLLIYNNVKITTYENSIEGFRPLSGTAYL